jgi:predicted porin
VLFRSDTTTWQLGGSYALGDTKLFAQYGSVDNDTSGMGYDITGLGASIKAGAGNVLAQWGRISPDSGAKRTTFSVGYDYFLSKRTDLYAVFMSDKISGLSGGTNYGVGIRHKF